MNVASIINDSYRGASSALVMGTSPPSLARARERVFVKTLVDQLQGAYSDDDVRVFSEYGRGNLHDFGTEKLLSDICVCRIAEGQTVARQPEDFLYIAAMLWQIEIEFSREWQRELQAVNRLIGGSAANKLLVAALMNRASEDIMNTFKDALCGSERRGISGADPAPGGLGFDRGQAASMAAGRGRMGRSDLRLNQRSA